MVAKQSQKVCLNSERLTAEHCQSIKNPFPPIFAYYWSDKLETAALPILCHIKEIPLPNRQPHSYHNPHTYKAKLQQTGWATKSSHTKLGKINNFNSLQ